MTPQDIKDLSTLINLTMQIGLFQGALMILGAIALVDWFFQKIAHAVDIWKYKRGDFYYCDKCNCINCVAETCRRAELAKEEGA